MSIEHAYDKNGNLIRDDNKGMTFTYDLLGHPLAIVGSDNQTDYVYSADGRKLRATHTYPYGGLMGDISTNDAHSYKYGVKELDRDFGIDLFDFEARQYDAKLPAFTSIDPLAEKYYGISPYAYCAGDPVNCIDSTGCEWYRNDYTGNYCWFAENKDGKGYKQDESPQWMPWEHVTKGITKPILNFIGSYGIVSFSDNSRRAFTDIIYDCKSQRSFMLHLGGNHSRTKKREFGNTYQFYIIKSSGK